MKGGLLEFDGHTRSVRVHHLPPVLEHGLTARLQKHLELVTAGGPFSTTRMGTRLSE